MGVDKELEESIVAELREIGEKEGLFRVSGKKIEYLTLKKSYNFTDPEEKVRVSFYYELIKKYQYPIERIDLEVIVPRREPTDKADIVVYEDDEKKKPYIVVECKKDGISQAEIKQAIEQAFGNANSLRSKLKPKDLIFTITGRIGTVAVVPENFGEGNINQHSVRIHLIDGVNEKYIAFLFNTSLGQSLSLRGVSGGTRIALDYEAIKSIPIPLPPRRIQDQIATIMEEAYKAKKQKETEVRGLLERAKKEVENIIFGAE